MQAQIRLDGKTTQDPMKNQSSASNEQVPSLIR